MRAIKRELDKLAEKVGFEALEKRGLVELKPGKIKGSAKASDYVIGSALPRTRKEVEDIIRFNRREGAKSYGKGKITPAMLEREAKRLVMYSPYVETDIRRGVKKFNYDEVKVVRDIYSIEERKPGWARTTLEAVKHDKKVHKIFLTNSVNKMIREAKEVGLEAEATKLEKTLKSWTRNNDKHIEMLKELATETRAELNFVQKASSDSDGWMVD